MSCTLVSVIIPNYNHASYLRQRIESVLAQSYQNIEVILLDDCSQDNSVDIMTSYKGDNRIAQIIVNKENTGSPFLQWERGLSFAKGEYIWIAESDDWAHSDFLQACVQELNTYSQASLCHTGSIFVDAKGNSLDKTYDKWREDGSVNVFRGEKYLRHNMTFWDDCYNASKVVFRRSAYERIAKTYTTFRYAGDWLFFASLAMQGDVVRINRKLNYYRWHDTNATLQGERMGLALQENIRKYAEMFCFRAFGRYNRILICGVIYKLIKRQAKTSQQRQTLMQQAYSGLGMRRWHYWLERLNKSLTNVFPWLPAGRHYGL